MAFFYLQGDFESSNLNTFILSVILIMGGLQVDLNGVLMKTYSVIHGYETKNGIIERIMNKENLETFLRLGSALLSIGTLMGINILIK
ncbi:MAG: hypothetical protein WCF90_09520 [Methanomicrobiales archaeon]